MKINRAVTGIHKCLGDGQIIKLGRRLPKNAERLKIRKQISGEKYFDDSPKALSIGATWDVTFGKRARVTKKVIKTL